MRFLVPKYGRVFYKKVCLKKTKYAPSADFLHTGPKKGMEKGYKVYFVKIWDNEIRHTFLG